MQYAEIVPNTKTDLKTQTFTYKIPPEILAQIKVGSLVLIPFGKRKIEGVVIEIKRLKGKIQKEKLKSISNLLDPEPVLDEAHLKLAKWMAEYYFAPLSLCLFEMIALPSRRKDKGERKKEKGLNEILSPKSYYLSPILKLCQRAKAKNKQILVLFKEVDLAKSLLPLFEKISKRGTLYHGELKRTERYKVFQKIKKGEADIVIGSRLAVFAPLPRLGLIIITDEESEAYKNERSPRYNVKTVAQKLADLTSTKLVLMSSTPSVESYWQAKRKNFYLFRQPLTANRYSLIAKIVDMKQELQKRNYGPFSETLQNVLKKIIHRNGRAILFINRKGAASYIFCGECGYVLRCPNCETPLTYHLELNLLVCHHCRFKAQAPALCPNCQGIQIRFRGPGTQRIETEVKKMFEKPEILRIEKDYMKLESPTSPKIIIGTQKLFSCWWQPVDLVAVISIDPLLNLPDFRQEEKIFSLISKLKSLASNLFLIQTYHPKNFAIQAALKGDYQSFYDTEIENRKKLNFPPFSKLIRIIYQHKNEKKCRGEMELVVEKLRSQISNLKSQILILGPSPCFYSKIRGKFRWQTIIKLKNQKSNLKSIEGILKTLPSEWIIDVDPVTLL